MAPVEGSTNDDEWLLFVAVVVAAKETQRIVQQFDAVKEKRKDLDGNLIGSSLC
jgi:hypothetical protein